MIIHMRPDGDIEEAYHEACLSLTAHGEVTDDCLERLRLALEIECPHALEGKTKIMDHVYRRDERSPDAVVLNMPEEQQE